MPPFASFFSEVFITTRLLSGGMYGPALAFIALLTVVMGGLSSAVLKMALGEPGDSALDYQTSRQERLLAQAPAYALLALAVMVNICLITTGGDIIRKAAILLGGAGL